MSGHVHGDLTQHGKPDAADRQKCLPHLLRELEKVDLRNDSAEWQAFAKKLRRLLRDGMRLRKRPDFAPGKFDSLVRTPVGSELVARNVLDFWR